MACIKLPKIDIPKLPAPFNFGVSLSTPKLGIAFCCILPPVSIPQLNISLGIPINPAIIATINAATTVVTNFIDTLELKCPRE